MTNAKTLNSKLKELRLHLNYKNQTLFAEKLGISQGAIANIESGKRDVSKTILLKIREVFNIDLIGWNKENNNENSSRLNSNIIAIPFYSAKAAAGTGETLPEYPENEVIYFDKRWLKNVLRVNPSNLSIIQAKGNSMDGGEYPIKDGDLLMIDESIKEAINKQIFVIQIDNSELVVKRTDVEWNGSVKFCSNNPNYGEVVPKDNAMLIGKVVWNGSKDNI